MNREIKFRGWHTKLKRMASAEELATDQLTLLTTGQFINVHSVSTSMSQIFPVDKFVPLQFTGLRDKNGVDIYEGDILLIPGSHEVDPPDDVKCVVEYLAPLFTRRYINAPDDWDGIVHDGLRQYDIIARQMEVIGNIYENPELLS